MRKPNIKAIAAATMLLTTAAAAYAVPAKPGIRQWLQADGTVINLQVVGDEHHHYYVTEDNYVIVDRDGVFYFAEIDGDRVEASEWKAANVGERSAALQGFLRRIDRDDILQTIALEGKEQRSTAAYGPGLFRDNHFPSKGVQKALVVLVQYTDVQFMLDDPHDYFTRMLNEPGFSDYGGTGSCKDFYEASSNGQFRPEFDVYGPITLAHPMAYYGGESGGHGDANAHQMAVEACNALDATVDFSQYDRDGDGIIDNVYVFYAGRGEATCSDPNTVWPHAGYVSGQPVYDGVKLWRYACSNEWEGSDTDGRPDGIGTFCHEFGHVIGLPDLYATTYPTPAPFTPGSYETMDAACYNNQGRTPALFSAFERNALDWIQPKELTAGTDVTLYPLATSNECYIARTSDENEFFLFENRQLQGWDAYIPGHGMLVWHILYNPTIWSRNTVNNNSVRQYVDIEEADNILTDATRDGDTFPGVKGIRTFTDDTTPSMRTWTNVGLGLPITDIEELAPYGIIKFKVGGGAAPAASTTAAAATDVTPRSFKAHWSAVTEAQNYLLSVYTKDAAGATVYAPGYNKRNVGYTTEFDVTGLEPSTAYLYSVTVESETATSHPSNEIAVNTGALTQEYVLPVVLAPSDVTDSGFTANWEAQADADDYILDVASRILRGCSEMTEDFTGKKSTWFTSSTTFYGSTSYSGESTPSLRMNPDDYICAPYADGTIHSLEFWYRGNKTNSDSRILVDAYVGDCWTPVASLSMLNKASRVSLNNIPVGATSVRVTYSNPTSTGLMYIDDLKLTYGGTAQVTPVAGFTGKSTGNVTSLEVDGLEPGTKYFYTVRSVKGGVRSMASNPQFVLTSVVSGIETIAPDAEGLSVRAEGGVLTVDTAAGSYVVICDVAGRTLFAGIAGNGSTTVSVGTPGVYVVKAGDKSAKIIVK